MGELMSSISLFEVSIEIHNSTLYYSSNMSCAALIGETFAMADEFGEEDSRSLHNEANQFYRGQCISFQSNGAV